MKDFDFKIYYSNGDTYSGDISKSPIRGVRGQTVAKTRYDPDIPTQTEIHKFELKDGF